MRRRFNILYAFVAGVICASVAWIVYAHHHHDLLSVKTELKVMAILASYADEGKYIVEHIEKGDDDAIMSAREEAMAMINTFVSAGSQFQEKHSSVPHMSKQLEQARDFMEKHKQPTPPNPLNDKSDKSAHTD